eukprot:6208272-Pleurochrysis_carterae.AAC.7
MTATSIGYQSVGGLVERWGCGCIQTWMTEKRGGRAKRGQGGRESEDTSLALLSSDFIDSPRASASGDFIDSPRSSASGDFIDSFLASVSARRSWPRPSRCKSPPARRCAPCPLPHAYPCPPHARPPAHRTPAHATAAPPDQRRGRAAHRVERYCRSRTHKPPAHAARTRKVRCG